MRLDLTSPAHALVIDPGPRTGWATLDGFDVDAGILDRVPAESLMQAAMAAHYPVLVMERFFITGASRQTDALEMIGVGKYLAREHGRELTLQAPGDMKFCPDWRLRALGLWVPGREDHARAALKHLVKWAAEARLFRPGALPESP